MAVMVQVSRLLTPRSRSLRRVATRSPTPIRSPASVRTARVSSSRGGPGVVGLARGAVQWGGIGLLAVLACVACEARGQATRPPATSPAEGEGAVGGEGGDGPGVAVAHAEVAVVAPGRDPVPDADPFPGVGEDRAGVV